MDFLGVFQKVNTKNYLLFVFFSGGFCPTKSFSDVKTYQSLKKKNKNKNKRNVKKFTWNRPWWSPFIIRLLHKRTLPQMVL